LPIVRWSPLRRFERFLARGPELATHLTARIGALRPTAKNLQRTNPGKLGLTYAALDPILRDAAAPGSMRPSRNNSAARATGTGRLK
jgi:hypothetical protein